MRFNHLEFEDASGVPQKQQSGESVRDAAYCYDRAQQWYLAGDFEQALRNYSRALEVSSSFFEGWAGQLRMLIELGEYPETLVWADKAMELFPEHPELLASKAVASARNANLRDAMGYSDNSISKERIGSRVWLARAEVLLQSKSRIAEECLSKALCAAGTQLDIVRLDTGRLLVRYKKYSAAMQHLQDSVRVFPKSALAWMELGVCQMHLGLSAGKTSLEQSLLLRPHWKQAQDALGRARSFRFFHRLFNRIG